ncbi:hypothetical protein KI387_028118, partial [Taxus chinensis]
KGKDEKNGKAEGEKKEESIQVVAFHRLFVTADSLDIMLMCIGSIGSVGIGLSYPFMTLLMGSLINAFGRNEAEKNKVEHLVSQIALKFVYLACGAGVASFL